MKRMILGVLISTMFLLSNQSLQTDLDHDGKLDEVSIKKDGEHKRIVYTLSSMSGKSFQSEALESYSSQIQHLEKSKNGFKYRIDFMRGGTACQFRYEKKSKKMQLIGMEHYEFGNAGHEGKGESSVNLLTGKYIAQWAYADYKKMKLITPTQTIRYYKFNKIYLDNFAFMIDKYYALDNGKENIFPLKKPSTNKAKVLNKGTKYQAELFEKKNKLYVKTKSKTKVLYTLEDEPTLYGDKLKYEIADFDFDGLEDVAVLTGLGYQGINQGYDVFLARKNYKVAFFSAINYELYPEYKTVQAHYKDGARHFEELYVANNKHELKHYVTYEHYTEDDICSVSWLPGEEDVSKIFSCKALLEEHKERVVWAKVIVKKALLYDNSYNATFNGMYLINGDKVELISGDGTDSRYLVRFKGKKVVTKWMDYDAFEIVDVK